MYYYQLGIKKTYAPDPTDKAALMKLDSCLEISTG